jgi:hypothetical protein
MENIEINNSSKNSINTIKRIAVLSALLICFQFLQTPAKAEESFFSKAKDLVISSVGFQFGYNLCGYKCAIPGGVAGLAISSISPAQVISSAGQFGNSFIGGFESWGRSFGRP